MVNYDKPPADSPFFDGELYQTMNEDLQLAGMSKRTVHGYLRAVRQLADWAQHRPDQITETQLRKYFLYLKNDKCFAYGSIRVAFSGIKFFYSRTCKRDWETLATMKLQQAKTLPEVLTIEQVHSIIDACRVDRIAVYFWTVYSMGLRLEEARSLQVGDIDSKRMMVHTMPVHHFLVTFTVPRELALVLRAHQRDGYRCLFDASSQSIRDVGAATKSLSGCRLGYFGVLHTWGRDLQTYHPHIHYVVPGGGVKVDERGNAVGWQSTPKNFLFHHSTLIRVYKAKLADELRAADLHQQVPASVWDKKFVVDIQNVGHAEPTLKYLAPYVHRVAIG